MSSKTSASQRLSFSPCKEIYLDSTMIINAMHCNTVTTFKVGKLSQNSMPNLFLTFHSCMYVHLFNVHPTRRMLCPWPKIWIQLLLLLSKIFNFHIWDQSDSESLTFGKAWTQRASGLLVSLYFELSVSNS